MSDPLPYLVESAAATKTSGAFTIAKVGYTVAIRNHFGDPTRIFYALAPRWSAGPNYISSHDYQSCQDEPEQEVTQSTH
jgi:hypothetical protein